MADIQYSHIFTSDEDLNRVQLQLSDTIIELNRAISELQERIKVLENAKSE